MTTTNTDPSADFQAQFAAIMQNVETAGTVLFYGIIAIVIAGFFLTAFKATNRTKATVRR